MQEPATAANNPSSATNPRPRRDAHVLIISRKKGNCCYEIVGQEDQQEFVIAPDSWVILITKDTDATVKIENDGTSDGDSTGNGGRRIKLEKGRKPNPFKTRKSGKGNTRHRLWIHCCESLQGQNCVGEKEAAPCGRDPIVGGPVMRVED